MKKSVLVVCLMFAGSMKSLTAAEAPAAPAGADSSTKEKMAAPAQAEAAPLKAEIKIGTGIEKWDPVGVADSFPSDTDKVVVWTLVDGAVQPAEITHVWSYKGQEVASVKLQVKSSHFRTYSRKTVTGMVGAWRLAVKDADGRVVATKNFEVTESTGSKSTNTP